MLFTNTGLRRILGEEDHRKDNMEFLFVSLCINRGTGCTEAAPQARGYSGYYKLVRKLMNPDGLFSICVDDWSEIFHHGI